MPETQENQEHEKEGVSIADIVKCAVLFWSATLLTVSYLGIFPQMKMDNTFVASLLTGAMASFGIERKANGQQKKQPPKMPGNGTTAIK
tara:strand:- start:2218 stop:2484 length:267 start_codon:yes stop_codon:yes gene_type:complete